MFAAFWFSGSFWVFHCSGYSFTVLVLLSFGSHNSEIFWIAVGSLFKEVLQCLVFLFGISGFWLAGLEFSGRGSVGNIQSVQRRYSGLNFCLLFDFLG